MEITKNNVLFQLKESNFHNVRTVASSFVKGSLPYWKFDSFILEDLMPGDTLEDISGRIAGKINILDQIHGVANIVNIHISHEGPFIYEDKEVPLIENGVLHNHSPLVILVSVKFKRENQEIHS